MCPDVLGVCVCAWSPRLAVKKSLAKQPKHILSFALTHKCHPTINIFTRITKTIKFKINIVNKVSIWPDTRLTSVCVYLGKSYMVWLKKTNPSLISSTYNTVTQVKCDAFPHHYRRLTHMPVTFTQGDLHCRIKFVLVLRAARFTQCFLCFCTHIGLQHICMYHFLVMV